MQQGSGRGREIRARAAHIAVWEAIRTHPEGRLGADAHRLSKRDDPARFINMKDDGRTSPGLGRHDQVPGRTARRERLGVERSSRPTARPLRSSRRFRRII